MREIILDTETTGISPAQGHRIVSLGVVEMMHGRTTGRECEWFFNPERDCDPGAYAVHGLSDRWLAKHPVFRLHAREVADFIGDTPIVAHNAKFDRDHLNYEYGRLLGYGNLLETDANRFPREQWRDSLTVARKRFPKQKNGLDDLADRFGVYRGHRIKHGALKDARILADVWMELQRNATTDLFEGAAPQSPGLRLPHTPYDYAARVTPLSHLTSADTDRWTEVWGSALGDKPVWNDYMKEKTDETEQHGRTAKQIQSSAPAKRRLL